MRRRQRRGDLSGDAQRFRLRQLAAGLFQPLGQRVALEVLHDQVGDAAWQLTVVRDLHDAGMLDDVDGSRLVEKSLCDLRLLRVATVQDLDGDATLDRLLIASYTAPMPPLPSCLTRR